MTILRTSMLVLCSLLLPGTASPERTQPSVDPHVSDVLSGGYFDHSGKTGSYRVVVECGGFEHVNCWMYSQWLVHESEGTRVAAAVPVPELNDRGFVFGRLERVESPGGLKVAGSARHNRFTSVEGRFELSLQAPGQYSLRWLEEPDFSGVDGTKPRSP